MAYIYGTKSTAKETELIRQLRQVSTFYSFDILHHFFFIWMFFSQISIVGVVHRTVRENQLGSVSILNTSLRSLPSAFAFSEMRFLYDPIKQNTSQSTCRFFGSCVLRVHWNHYLLDQQQFFNSMRNVRFNGCVGKQLPRLSITSVMKIFKHITLTLVR